MERTSNGATVVADGSVHLYGHGHVDTDGAIVSSSYTTGNRHRYRLQIRRDELLLINDREVPISSVIRVEEAGDDENVLVEKRVMDKKRRSVTMIGSLYSGISGIESQHQRHGGDRRQHRQCGYHRVQVRHAYRSPIFSVPPLSQTNIQIGRGVTLNGSIPSGKPGPWRIPPAPPTFRSTAPGCSWSATLPPTLTITPGPGSSNGTKTATWSTRRIHRPGLFGRSRSTGDIGTIGDITLPNGSSAPNPTSRISVSG